MQRLGGLVEGDRPDLRILAVGLAGRVEPRRVRSDLLVVQDERELARDVGPRVQISPTQPERHEAAALRSSLDL